MTNITLMTEIATAMRSEGWQERPAEERIAEHSRRYQAALHGRNGSGRIERIDAINYAKDGRLSVTHDGTWHMMTLEELLTDKYKIRKGHAALLLSLMEEWGQRLADVDAAAQREYELRNLPRCNGNWSEQSDGRVYITHGSGQCCPLHGDAPGQYDRIRAYVGKRPDKQVEARAALDNWATWQAAAAELNRVRSLAERMESNIISAGARQQRLQM